jgi:hypothetical protein
MLGIALLSFMIEACRSMLPPKYDRMLLVLLCILGIPCARAAAAFRIDSLSRAGRLTWTNAQVPGVCVVEDCAELSGSWTALQNLFATNSAGLASVLGSASNLFFRVRSSDVSATSQGFTNLVYCYGVLETIAGSGGGQLDISYWQPWYEGWPATWVALSRPHMAMADRAGNIYIADKNSHSILKVSPQGTLTTFARTHTGGFNGEGPALATTLQLNFPNGEWIGSDSTVYVFDTNNGRIRRVDTNGVMRTLFIATTDGSAVSGGRGLWVKDDGSLAYFCAGTKLKKWTPAGGVRNLASNFAELGNLIVESNGKTLFAAVPAASTPCADWRAGCSARCGIWRQCGGR